MNRGLSYMAYDGSLQHANGYFWVTRSVSLPAEPALIIDNEVWFIHLQYAIPVEDVLEIHEEIKRETE
tara:strand:+ start:1559 stop:1762 length:204 start_codon:yes stop_codon:yes gene_type:complete